MSDKQSYIDKIDKKIRLISDSSIRAMMMICQGKQKYPKDCINDGGLDVLVSKILELESNDKRKQ